MPKRTPEQFQKRREERAEMAQHLPPDLQLELGGKRGKKPWRFDGKRGAKIAIDGVK